MQIDKAIEKKRQEWDMKIHGLKLELECCHSDEEKEAIYKQIESFEELRDKMADSMLNNALQAWERQLGIYMKLKEVYERIEGRGAINQWYSITIRPAEGKVTFIEFYDKVYKFLQRKFFNEWTLSFEQKGTSEETLGTGFHCHIVADTKHRSVGECLRDLNSSFSQWAEKNYIVPGIGTKVTTCKTPDKMIQNYLIDYKSDDGHKEPTKEWDERWRQELRLAAIYRGDMPKRPIGVSSVTKLETDETKNVTTIRIIEKPTITFQ